MGTTVGIALWSASGTGSGSAKAVTAQALTATAAASPTADLYPGASVALQFTVGNTNPYAISLTSINYGTVTSSDQPAPGLTATNLVVACSVQIAWAAPPTGEQYTIRRTIGATTTTVTGPTSNAGPFTVVPAAILQGDPSYFIVATWTADPLWTVTSPSAIARAC